MADTLSRKSGMIAGIKHGYWASLRVEPDLISRIKEAQKEDSEIWTIIENLDEQTEFRLDEDDVLWQGTRLCVPNDVSLREALLTEAYSSPFSVHPGSTKMYHDLKQHFWWSGMKRDETLSALEEVFGALITTGLSKVHIASMWSVNGGFSGIEKETLEFSNTLAKYQNSASMRSFSFPEPLNVIVIRCGKDTEGLEGLDLEEDSP
nr:retrotransposon protein, putative, Ty3-gypsy subclass [Tanacetum cinerariifolium]